MSRRTLYLVALLAVGLAGPALAQKKKKAAAKPPKDIIVLNARTAVLTGFSLANAKGQVMAAIAKPIEPGKRAVLRLRPGATCELAVTAQFDDEAESSGDPVDVCADKTVRLTD